MEEIPKQQLDAATSIFSVLSGLDIQDDFLTISGLVILSICFLATLVFLARSRPWFAGGVFVLSLASILYVQQQLFTRASEIASKATIDAEETMTAAPLTPTQIGFSEEGIADLTMQKQKNVLMARLALAERVEKIIGSGTEQRSAKGRARCRGGGDEESASVTLDAGQGYVIVGDVISKVSGQYESYESVKVSPDGKSATQRIRCRSPRTLFGPGGWADGRLTATVQRKLSDDEIAQLRIEVAGEFGLEPELLQADAPKQ